MAQAKVDILSNDLNKHKPKFDWESFSEAMDNDKDVVIVDNEETRYRGKIVRSDNRSTIVLLNDGERRVVFNLSGFDSPPLGA